MRLLLLEQNEWKKRSISFKKKFFSVFVSLIIIDNLKSGFWHREQPLVFNFNSVGIDYLIDKHAECHTIIIIIPKIRHLHEFAADWN